MKTRLLTFVAAIGLAITQSASAATQTWNGLGGNNSWTTGLNWTSGNATASGDSLIFDGSTQLSNNNNLTANSTIAGLTFNSGAGAFVLAGNAIAFNGTLTDNATNTQTVSLNMTLTGGNNQSVVVASGGNLILSGALSRAAAPSSGNALALTGGGTLAVTGNWTATNVSIGVAGNSTLTLNAGNTITGRRLGLSSGNITVGSGTYSFAASSSSFGETAGAFVTNYNQTAGSITFNTLTTSNGIGTTTNMNISGGSLIATTLQTSRGITGGNGTIINLSGTGLINTGTFKFGDGGTDNANSINTVTIGTGAEFRATTAFDWGNSGATVRHNTVEVNGGKFSTVATTATNASSNATLNLGNGGTLEARSASTNFLNGLDTFNLKDGGGVINTNGNNITITNNILNFAGATTASLTKNGTGTLTLTGNSSYAGDTIVNGGTLLVDGAGKLGAGNYAGAILNSSTLSFNGTSSQTLAGSIGNNGTISITATGALTASGPIANNGALSFNSTATHALSGNISGTGSLTNANTGTVNLSGANSYTGGTAVTAGVLTLLNFGAKTGNITVSPGATLGLGVASGNASYFDAPDIDHLFAGTLPEVTNDATSNVGIDTAAGNYTYASSVPATTRGLTKLGANTLILTGNNLFTGPTSVNAGTLVLSASGSLAAGSPLNLTGGALDLDGASQSVGAVSISAPASSGDTIANGNLTATSYSASNTTGNALVSANLLGSGVALTKSGAGILSLSGTNTYDGGSTVNAGVLSFLNTNAKPASGNITVVAGATLGLGVATAGSYFTATDVDNLFADTYVGVSMNATAAVGIDTSAGNFTYAPTGSSSRGLTKLGANKLTYTGNNTYNGTTTISGGTLEVGDGITEGSITSTANVVNNGALIYTVLGNQTLAKVVSGTGTLTKEGAGTLTLNATNTFTGNTTINAGTVVAPAAGSLGAGSVVNNATLNLTAGGVNYTGLSNALGGNGTNNVTVGTGSGSTILNGNYSAFTGTWNVGVGAAAGAGKVQMNGLDNPATTINILTNAAMYVTVAGTRNATLTLGGGDTGESLGQLRVDTVALTWAGPVTLTGTVTGSGDYTFGGTGTTTITSNISETGGAQSIKKGNTGTLVLTGNNNVSGPTSVLAGTLTMQHANALGSGSANVTVTSGGTVALQGGIATPTKALILDGQGVGSLGALRSVSGNNTWNGDITVGTQAVSRIGSDADLLTLSGNIIATGNSSSQVVLQGNGNIAVPGIISGAAILNSSNTGAGTRIVSGNNTFTGGVSVNGGTLRITNSGALGVGNKTVTATASNNKMLELDGSGGDINLPSNMLFSVSGINGVLTNVAGNNTVAGAFSLTSGNGNTKILSNGGSLLLSGNVTTAPAAGGARTYDLDGTSTGANTVSGVISNGSFTMSVNKGGNGTWTLAGANTYTGTTTVTAGTLIISSAGNITSSASTVSGGTLRVDGLAGAVTVDNTGTLGGNGTVGALIVNAGGTLAPGNSPGILTASSVSLNGTTNMELAGNGGVAGTDFDRVTSTGSLTYGGALNILSFGGYDITQAASYSLFTFSSQSGDFASVTVGVTGLTLNTGVWTGTDISGNSYTFSQLDGTLVVAIPEPKTWALIGLGLGFTLFRMSTRARRLKRLSGRID